MVAKLLKGLHKGINKKDKRNIKETADSSTSSVKIQILTITEIISKLKQNFCWKLKTVFDKACTQLPWVI